MKILYEAKEGYYEEKKSKFIATLKPVNTEEEAQEFIAAMKKQYWDARHNCSAYVIGDANPITRCSDDGEPAQTAGRPMLDVLLKEDIHNIAVVVTRYFGGVLLGTGGLVRAYQKATQDGLANSVIIDRQTGIHVLVECDYNDLGKVEYYIRSKELAIQNTEYAAGVVFDILVPKEQAASVEKDITDQTAARAKVTVGDPQEYGILDKEIILF